MKKIINMFLVIMIGTTAANAQLKVFSTGNISVGGSVTSSAKLFVLGDGIFSSASSGYTSAAYIRANSIFSGITTPDYSWAADDQTGLFHPATSVIGFSIAGAERLRVHANGILMPNGVIQVGGTAIPSTTTTDLGLYSLNASSYIRFVTNSGSIRFFTDGTSGAQAGTTGRVTIEPSGNVGIGTMTPGSALDVKGSIRLSGSTSGYVGFAPAAAAGSTTYTLPAADGTSGQALQTNGSGTLSWGTKLSGSGTSSQVAFWNGTSSLSSSSNLYWDNTNSRLGIGTSTPAQKLELAGVERITGAGSKLEFGTGSNRYLGYLSSGSGDLALISSEAAYWLRIGSAGGLALWGNGGTNTSPDVFVDVTGSVGIATTSPSSSYKLDVVGSTRCTSGSWSVSDARYKKNIKTIENPLEKIMKLNGKTYEFRTDEFKQMNFNGGSNIGFIAQELKEVLPEAVRQDEKGFYSVNYDEVIPLLVEGIKAQQKTIQDLEAKTEELQSAVENVQKDMGECCKLNQASGSQLTGASTPVRSALDQNVPNPFTEKTVVNFFVANVSQNISISIFDMQGTLLKTFDHLAVTNGKGNVTITGNELKPGMYMYSLIVDGREIDTKRMILTK